MTNFAIRISRLPRAVWVLSVFPLLGLTCPFSESADCTLGDQKFAIEVSFYDAITNDLLTGPTPGAIGEGDYSDSLRVIAFDSDHQAVRSAAGESRTGIYRLTAKRSGYQAFVQSNIRVGSGPCGIIPVGIEAKLQPE